jgi:hypothetical protein
VLLASASIPGLFPPVAIEAQANGRTLQELHADGGITTPFFLAPEPALLGRGQFVRTRAPAQAYVIVNNQLAPEFQITDRTLITVLGRSLSAAVKAGTRAAVMAHGTYGRRNGIALQFATIDGRLTEASKAPFEQAYMRALFAHGERLGRDGVVFGATRSAGPAGRPWRRGERHETVLASRHDDDRRNRESGFEAPSERARCISGLVRGI